jgi:peptidoglycan DL-endopeptidase CwlO
MAAPGAPAAPAIPPAVPDIGSRPIPLGTLTMPGQIAATTPATTTPVVGSPASSPLVAKIQKQRDEISTLGDKLIELGQNRDLARQQLATADQKVTTAQTELTAAQQEAATAASAAMLNAAALPPGSLGSGLDDLGSLAAIQQGQSAGDNAAARELALAQAAMQSALTEQSTATASSTALSEQYDKLNASIAKKQAALQTLEDKNADALNAADAAEAAADAALGQQYLQGADDGRGADPKAIKAVEFALAQRGKPYVWSTEGPSTYDCSGLTWASYQSAGFSLQRVSRDQYWQTHNKVVDRYSLLPGDLLFFSYSTSWTDIHHVAIYAGKGMMVEAPRTGLNVRLTPVRWSTLFQATRVFGSVEGTSSGPDLGGNPATTPPPSTTPPVKPTSKPPTTPTSKPPTTPTSKPPTSPSSTPPSSSGSPSPTPDPSASSSSGSDNGGSTSPSDGSSNGSSTDASPTGSEAQSSATASATGSDSASASASS